MEEKLKNHFLNLYHMALSDTEIDASELTLIYLIGEEKGITKEEINAVVLQPDSIRFYFPETVFEKVDSLFDLARIAWADGIIDDNERKLLNLFAKKFGFEDENIPTIVQLLLDEVKKGTTRDELLKIVTNNI